MVNLQSTSKLIFKVAIPAPFYQLFDYLGPEQVNLDAVKPGVRLEVPFGRGKKIAYLMAIAQETDVPSEKLKQVLRIVDEQPLLSSLDLELCYWVSHYYHHPIGEVISAALPAGLRQGKACIIKREQRFKLTELGKAIDPASLKRAPQQQHVLAQFRVAHRLSETELAQLLDGNWRAALKQLINKGLLAVAEADIQINTQALIKTEALLCNPAQQAAITSVCGHLGKFGVFLLEGVTGSGKTEVYMQIIHAVLAKGLQVLVLVPEISLTPQLEARFRQRFAVNIAISHSKLSDTQRQNTWLQMQQGSSAILLGTRSAVFTALKKPGLIILDEEHDSSFKQQEGFRFSARDVAVVRGKLLNIPVLLGSATPSLESLYNVEKKRYQWLHLPERAGSSIAPVLQLLDIRNKKMREGLSEALITEIKKTIANHEQALLFLNRRGYAPTLICHSCGWVARCLRCDANLVIHTQLRLLRCHHCAQEQVLPTQCPACQAKELTALGLGTERVEQALREIFADHNVVRLDRDSTQRKGALEGYLAQINDGHADIILGTQMLAKGHHFPNVTLVAILDVDSGLFSIDFHASEKLAQLIEQVSGRAGRAEKPGKVIMQTRRPEHPLLTTLIANGYHGFARTALSEREQALLPPFSYQALLRAYAADAALPQGFLEAVLEQGLALSTEQIQILGPVSAPMAKRRGLYHYQLLFQSGHRQALHQLLDALMPTLDKSKQAKKVRWSLDVDPVDLY